tara:strand:- start:69 stop:1790 length:1722 start_codon:yes stop_codon:yes gene_type:complete
MKRILLFTLLISFIGYSQNPIQPNHQNFNDGLPQDLVERKNPMNFELGDDEMDFNPIQRVGGMKPHSFQSEMDNQSDNGITYRLDGSTDVYVGSEDLTNKYTRSYNENGDQTLYIIYDWNTDSQSFIPNTKYEYSYDENGNQNLRMRYTWNTDSQSFIPSRKYEYSHDENGYQTSEIHSNWSSDSQSFIPNNKYEYTYDVNGNLTLYIVYSWDTTTQSFVPNDKHEFTYDENGNQTIRIYYTWDTTTQSFVPNDKNEYSYDDSGNRMESRFVWNSVIEIFIPNNKDFNEYDEQDRILFMKRYQYDICNETKTQIQQYQFIYDDELDGRTTRLFTTDNNGGFDFYFEKGTFYNENGLIVFRFQNANPDLLPTDYNWSREYSYDTEGNNIEEILSKWDTQTESLVPSEKEIRVYDYDFHPRYLTQFRIEKYFPGLGFKPSFEKDFSIHSETDTELVIVGTIKQYDTNFNTWSELQGEEFRSYWYYTKTPSLSTNSVESNLFSIYPNPTSSTLQINSSEYLKTPMFELYDVKGSKILSSPFKLTEPIDVSDLQPSMYIYNVKDGSEVKQSGKVLIE